MAKQSRGKIYPTYIKHKSINGNDTCEIGGEIHQLCERCNKFKLMTEEFFEYRLFSKCFKPHCKDCKHWKPSRKDNPGNIGTSLAHFNEKGELLCRNCDIHKIEDEFNIDGRQKYRNFKSLVCKECENLRSSNKYDNVEISVEKHLKKLLTGCKQRVKPEKKTGSTRGKECSITYEDLFSLWKKQQGLCAISGLQMTTIVGRGKYIYNISIDRIDSNISYIPSNIQLVCSIVNLMKNTLSLEELIFFCNAIIKNNESKNS